jgi:hypothetical protein
MKEEEFKKRISIGPPLRFAPGSPDSERTIEASWLTKADIPLDLGHAIIEGNLSLCDSRIEHPWIFKNCIFRGAIDLAGSTFACAVRFDGCTCADDVKFDRCRFLNGLLCNPTHFEKGFRMVAARVNGDCEFVGSAFTGEAKFARMRTDDELRFSHKGSHAAFCQKVSFLQMRVGGELMLDDCIFRSEVEFYNIEVGGPAFFRRTQFLGEQRFRHSRFRAEVNFEGANFAGNSDMTYTSFGEELRFECTNWNGNALDLSYAQVNGDLVLSKSTQGDCVLRSVSVRGLVFDEVWLGSAVPSMQATKINLSNASYERIQPEGEKPNELVRSLVDAIKTKADISTRRKLVAVLNRQGMEENARDAERILRRGARSRLSSFQRGIDFAYDLFFDYGISPWIVALLPLFLCFLGSIVYSQPHAVVWKMNMEEKKPVELSCKPNQGSGDIDCIATNAARKTNIGYLKALAVSLHYALPGEIAMGSDYEASDERIIAWFPVLTSEGYATVQRIVGWITIPLIVAASAGLIWRRPGEKESESELD